MSARAGGFLPPRPRALAPAAPLLLLLLLLLLDAGGGRGGAWAQEPGSAADVAPAADGGDGQDPHAKHLYNSLQWLPFLLE